MVCGEAMFRANQTEERTAVGYVPLVLELSRPLQSESQLVTFGNLTLVDNLVVVKVSFEPTHRAEGGCRSCLRTVIGLERDKHKR